MRPITKIATAAAAFVGLSAGAFAAASLGATETALDLGQAPAGTVDIIEVEARNQSCDEPQNFRFAPRGLPWVKLVNGSLVRGVERGKAKWFVAEIDLKGLRPGRYSGRLDVICDTCGDFVLSRCHIDVKSIAVSVQVVPG